MKKLVNSVIVILCTLLLWQLLYWLIASPIVPSPWAVIANFFSSLFGKLPQHIGMSALRVTVSSFFALLIGIPLGIAIGYKASWDKTLSPFIYLSYPIPKLALLPIIMLLFGLGEISKTIMIFLIIFFPIVVDCAGAVKAMDKEIFMVLRAFGAGGKYICAKIIAPGIIPNILVSLKITTGIALSILFFAENFGTQTGLGYLIMTSWQKLDYVNLYTGILTLSLLGFAIFLALDILEKRFTAWK